MKARMKETLPQGLQKGEPLYRWCVALEVLIFVALAASLAEVLWPWLSGRAPEDGEKSGLTRIFPRRDYTIHPIGNSAILS